MRKRPVNNLITNQEKTSSHPAPAQQQFTQQETVEKPCPQSVGSERVLARLWELANLSHEMTRNSISGQIKALSMIVAIEGLIPDRAAQKQPAPTAPEANIYKAPWLVRAQAKAAAEAAGFVVTERDDISPSPEPPEDDLAVKPTPDPESVVGKSIPAQPSWAPSPYESFVPNARYR
jgi:hypothetical protein